MMDWISGMNSISQHAGWEHELISGCIELLRRAMCTATPLFLPAMAPAPSYIWPHERLKAANLRVAGVCSYTLTEDQEPFFNCLCILFHIAQDHRQLLIISCICCFICRDWEEMSGWTPFKILVRIMWPQTAISSFCVILLVYNELWCLSTYWMCWARTAPPLFILNCSRAKKFLWLVCGASFRCLWRSVHAVLFPALHKSYMFSETCFARMVV